MSDQQGQHVFVSYVRDDDAKVDALCKVLEASQIPYWRDRTSLAPGDAWKSKIREAIQDGALVFLACFSDSSRARDKSTMNEELMLAVEEFRKMPPGRTWLIPVRFDNGDVPPWELGGNKMLSDLNYVDLFGDSYAPQAGALVTTIHKLMGSARPDPANALAAAEETGGAERSALLRRLTKEMLPDPTRHIQLDDLISQEVRHIIDAMDDTTRFPQTGSGTTEESVATTLIDTARRYWALVEPFCFSLQVAARWATVQQLAPWISGLKTIVAKATEPRTGEVVLADVREVAACAPIVVAALACVASERWDNLRLLLADQTLPAPYTRNETMPLLEATSFYEPFKNAELAVNVLSRSTTTEASIEEALEYYGRTRGGRFYTPFADWVHAIIHPVFNEQILDSATYDREFDRAEAMLGIVHQDAETVRYAGHENASYLARSRWFGRSTWRAANHANNPVETLRLELERQSSAWPPLHGGLFGTDLTRAQQAVNDYETDFTQIARKRF